MIYIALCYVCVFVTKTCDNAHMLNVLYFGKLLIVNGLMFWYDY